MSAERDDQDQGQPGPRKRGIFARFRANFITGLVVISPIGLTLWLIWTVTGWIDGWVLPFVPAPYQPDALVRDAFGTDAPINVRGVGVIVFLIFTVFVGWIAKGIMGRSLLRWGESIVDRMPVVRSIYNGVKQVAETVFNQADAKFDKACLVEYPRKGMWGVGFVATAAKGELLEKLPGEEVMTVFVPTTPNPTSGFLLYVPKPDVIFLDMSVEDAAKLIISAGLVYPLAKDLPVLPATPGTGDSSAE